MQARARRLGGIAPASVAIVAGRSGETAGPGAATSAGETQETSFRKTDAAIVCPPIPASENADLMNGITRESYRNVGGVERLHLAGDLGDGLGGVGLVAERRADLLGDPGPGRRGGTRAGSAATAARRSSRRGTRGPAACLSVLSASPL